MRKHERFKVLLLFSIGLFFLVLTSTIVDTDNDVSVIDEKNEDVFCEDDKREDLEDDDTFYTLIKDLKTSDYTWVDPFIIDGEGGGDYTWDQLADEESWCIYDGGLDAYIIGGIGIDGSGFSNEAGIHIRDDDQEFIITSSFIRDTDWSGILIENCEPDFGMIVDCEIGDSNSNGIFIGLSGQITVMGGDIYHCDDGVRIVNSHDCTIGVSGDGIDIDDNSGDGIHITGTSGNDRDDHNILDNDLTDNDNGVFIDDCDDVYIIGNYIEGNSEWGILATDTNEITVADNEIIANSFGGIDFDIAESVIIQNTIYNNGGDGINLHDYSDLILIQLNDIDLNAGNGITIDDFSDDIYIYQNNITRSTSDGIEIGNFEDRFLISGNLIENNGGDGIVSVWLRDSNLTANKINFNGDEGLDLKGFNCTIEGLNATGNTGIGIRLEGDELEIKPLISAYPFPLVAQGNDGGGIYIYDSDLEELSSCLASDNGGHGIYIQDNDGLFLTDLIATGNGGSGLALSSSDNVKIVGNENFYNNFSANTGHGISLSGGNTYNLTWNRANENGEAGIYLNNADSTHIFYNVLMDNGYGLFGENDLSYLDLRYNIIINSLKDGLHLEDLTDSTTNYVFENYLHKSGRSGMHFKNDALLKVTHNWINQSEKNGMVLESLDQAIVSDNFIFESGVYGIKGNGTHTSTEFSNNIIRGSAIDGLDNSVSGQIQWYNATSQRGNWWEDYSGVDRDPADGIGDSPYTLTGSSGVQDLYPLHGVPIFRDGRDGTPLHIDGYGVSAGSFEWLQCRWWNAKLSYFELWQFFYNETLLKEYLTATYGEEHKEVHFNGTGTELDPFILADLLIDGEESESCLTIENSVSYFTLTDCFLTNSGNAANQAGLVFNNVAQGSINSLYIYNNTGHGIFLNASHDNDFYDIYSGSFPLNLLFEGTNGKDGLRMNASYNNNFDNLYLLENSKNGINMSYCWKNNFLASTIGLNGKYGLFLTNSTENTFDTLEVLNNGLHGIALINNVTENEIIDSIISFNDESGIYLLDASNNTIEGNWLEENADHGIWLRYSNNNTFYDNDIINNFDHGINAFRCNNTFLSWNDIRYQGKDGLFLLECHWFKLERNKIYSNDGYGAYLQECQNVSMTNNNHFDSNNKDGLALENCNNAYLHSVYASSNNWNGIYLYREDDTLPWTDFDRSNYHTLISPFTIQNEEAGILFEYCNYSVVQDATVIKYNSIGIKTLHCWYMNFTGNVIQDNYVGGLNLYHDFYDLVWENTFSKNDGYGIKLEDKTGICDFWNNEITDNGDYGILCIDSQTIFNKFWLNTFARNGIYNAKDNGLYNEWDNGTMGNSWDDYEGYDLDDDGIGFTQYHPYSEYGYMKNDSFPLTDRKDLVAPIITINFPQSFSVYENILPLFNITIDEYVSDFMWYELETITSAYNYDYSGAIYYATWEGAIDFSIWSLFGNGTLSLTFYAQDSKGNIGSTTVLLNKDTLNPDITILSPESNEPEGSAAPSFQLTINEGNLNLTWYYLTNGTITTSNTFFIGFYGVLNQTAWELFTIDGEITIRFYANDTLGHIKWEEVLVIKDTSIPELYILSPAEGEDFKDAFPTVTFIKIGTILGPCWYTIDEGDHNFFIIGSLFIINENAWLDAKDGDLTLTVYLQNLVGVTTSDSVIIEKDTTKPKIEILSPDPNERIATKTPKFSLSINSDAEIQSMWYVIDKDDTKYFFTDDKFTLDEDEWAYLDDDETITIKIYVNTTFGGLGYEEITIVKDFQADDTTLLDDLLAWLLALIALILGFIGLGTVLLFRKNRERCHCLGESDCSCSF